MGFVTAHADAFVVCQKRVVLGQIELIGVERVLCESLSSRRKSK